MAETGKKMKQVEINYNSEIYYKSLPILAWDEITVKKQVQRVYGFLKNVTVIAPMKCIGAMTSILLTVKET